MIRSYSILVISILASCFHLSCKRNLSRPETGHSSTDIVKGNDNSWQYFGQATPSVTPIVFAPGIISKSDRYEFACTISKDGKEFYFGVSTDKKSEIHSSNYKNGQWTEQNNLLPSDSISYNDPMLSPDENRLYFISDRPLQSSGKKKDIDLWYIERNVTGWSDPKNLGAPINNHLDQYYSSFNSKGTLYFGSRDTSKEAPRYAFDIYKSKWIDGEFTTPIKLSKEINTDGYEADVFIAPDDSYMIFCSIRKNGMGEGDLYISFKDAGDNWKEAINMGELINTDGHELCPYVSPDGKYFFYTSKKDIYWVSTDIFENYKTTSF